ncbi:MAG: hypothetical protein Salg2KO_17890 [Salibacteraceae bacterium]
MGLAQSSYKLRAVDKLDAALNSSVEESLPLYSPDGKLYFVRTLYDENVGGKLSGQDIWVSQKVSNSWSEPTNNLDRLNTRFNNAVIGVADSGRTLFLNGSYSTKEEYQTGVSMTKWKDGKWKRPKNLRIKGFNPKAPYVTYYVNGDEGIMLLSFSESRDTIDENIYVSFLKKGRVWSKPESLGPTINTPKAEFSPFIDNDGKTIYFSSDGHGGLGGADVFRSYRLDDTWSAWSSPENLGAPLNSEGFDAYFTKNGDSAYFSSNRGAGLTDIYFASFEMVDNKPSKEMQDGDMTKENLFALEGFLDIENPGRVGMVRVMNTDGMVVQRVKPKNDGSFLVRGLDKYNNYYLDLDGQEKEIADLQIFFVNQDGSRVYLNEGILNGQYPFETLDKDIRAVLMAEVSEDNELGLTEFTFDEEQEIPAGSSIYLYDENGQKQETAVVNRQGQFEFKSLLPGRVYQLELENGTLTPNSKIYIFNEGQRSEIPGNILRGALFKKLQGQLIALDPNSKEGMYAYKKLRGELTDADLAGEFDSSELDATTFGFEYGKLPPEGTRVVLTDEYGNIVDESYTDADGIFKFKKLDPDLKYSINLDEASDYEGDLSLYLVDDDGLKVPVAEDVAKGKAFEGGVLDEVPIAEDEQQFSFQYSALPPVGTKVYLTDEQDNILDSSYVDSEGHFKFKKLDPTERYLLKMYEGEDSELDVNYFIVDDLGNTLKVAKGNEKGDVIKAGEVAARNHLISKFAFDYRSLPAAGSMVYLVDDNGNIVDSSFVDPRGNFRFRKLDPDMNYTFRVDDEDFDFSSAALYAMENGLRRKLKKLPNGFALYSLDLMDVADAELDLSKFQLEIDGDVPEDAHAYLYDEETDEIIEEVEINEDGSFSFEQLDPDRKYDIRFDQEVDEMQARYFAVEAPDIQLDIAAVLDEEKAHLEAKKAAEEFAAKKAAKELAMKKAEEEKRAKEARLAQEKKEAESKRQKLSDIDGEWVVYFDFNEFLLKPDQIKLLREEVAVELKANQMVHIEVEGHADNRGTDEVNYRMSVLRISNVIYHLEMNGVEDTRIKAIPKGETEPIASNDTPEGRAKNRRVEIKIINQ